MKHFNDLRMWQKQLLSCILVFIIPFSVCFYLAHSMKSYMMEEERRQALSSMERVIYRLESLLSTTISTSSSIACDHQIIEYITTDYADTYSQIEASWKSGNLSSYLANSENALDGFFFFCDDPDVLNTGFIKYGSEKVRSSLWYQNAAAHPLTPLWTYIDNDSFTRRGMKNLALCRSVYHQKQLLGVLCVYVNERALDSIVSQEEYQTIILDPSMQIVAASSPELKGLTIDAIGISDLPAEGIHQISYQGGRFDLLIQRTDFPVVPDELTVLILYDRHQVQELSIHSSRLYYMATFASGIICLSLMLIISRLMCRRLETIGKVMHIVAEGDFTHPITIDGNDEVGQLATDLNSMIASLSRLIEENYQISLEKQKLENYQKDIQLQILSGQINPHFLFNTLESIRMMSLLNGHSDVSSAIQCLSSLMRRSLYSANSPVSLKEELMLVEDYLSLQKLRLGPRLSYQININGAIDRVLILPFLIQPIVENVIKHGLESKSSSSGYVIVDINCTEQDLIINVADNGAGMPPEALSVLQESIRCNDDMNPQSHIGIRNVSQRIHLYYGFPYALSIHSALGIGTVVTIRIPKRTAEEE